MPVNPPRPPAARMKNHANTWAIAQEKIVAKTARCVQTIRHAKRKVAAPLVILPKLPAVRMRNPASIWVTVQVRTAAKMARPVQIIKPARLAVAAQESLAALQLV